MGQPELDFYFDFSSPYAYLGVQRIEALAESGGAQLNWKPMLLGGVFKALGGPLVPLTAGSPAKQRYNMKDMLRWAEHFEIPFKWPSRFPMNTVKPLRIALLLDDPADFIKRVFRAYWAEDLDIKDPGVLTALLDELSLPTEFLERTADPAVKQLLIDATTAAVNAGVFGAPTCVVGDELFFGQDRYQFVLKALNKAS